MSALKLGTIPIAERYIFTPPEILAAPHTPVAPLTLYIVGTRSLLLHDIISQLSGPETAVVNALQQVTQQAGRESAFASGEIYDQYSLSHAFDPRRIHTNALTRTVERLAELSAAAGAPPIIDRIPRVEGGKTQGSGSGVRYRFNKGVAIKSLLSPELTDMMDNL